MGVVTDIISIKHQYCRYSILGYRSISYRYIFLKYCPPLVARFYHPTSLKRLVGFKSRPHPEVNRDNKDYRDTSEWVHGDI